MQEMCSIGQNFYTFHLFYKNSALSSAKHVSESSWFGKHEIKEILLLVECRIHNIKRAVIVVMSQSIVLTFCLSLSLSSHTVANVYIYPADTIVLLSFNKQLFLHTKDQLQLF